MDFICIAHFKIQRNLKVLNIVWTVTTTIIQSNRSANEVQKIR